MQGSAADFCKAAMVALHARASVAFAGRPEACRLILQASTISQKLAIVSASLSSPGYTHLPHCLAMSIKDLAVKLADVLVR